MEARVGLLFLFVLSAIHYNHARQLASVELIEEDILISDGTVVKLNILRQEGKVQDPQKVLKNEEICTFCEEYATEALEYLANNDTQTEVIEMLHMTCSKVPPFKKECITMVDYYVPLFFLEVSTIQPELLCQKVSLCGKAMHFPSNMTDDKCDMCHHAVSEIIDKLQDPDTQLEVIQILLKGCESMQNYAKKCKRLVFEYGPIIMANAEQFLETKDLCTMLRACNGAKPQLVADS